MSTKDRRQQARAMQDKHSLTGYSHLVRHKELHCHQNFPLGKKDSTDMALWELYPCQFARIFDK